MTLAPGTRLGSYEILAPLGSGGMGEVYRARDTKLGREVAIKVLPAAFTDDAERRERFEREARAASALSHPNVATIYEFGESEGRAFIAMELVEGQSLTARIAGQPLATRDLVDLALQVADALEEAHGRGITHRDIKPGNLMVTPRGRVKVLDFGLARLAPHDADGDASTLMATRAGTALGTVPYMSPEQALGRDVDPRSDLFSLGAVIYEMATGRRAFDGGSASATTDLILHSQPMAIARLNYEAPAELERIVRKCLEKDRERRYQSARELVVDLGTLKRDLESGSGAAALRTPADGSPAVAPGSHVSTVPPSAPQASSSLASGAAAAAQPPSSAASGAPAAAAWRRRRVVVAAGVAVLVLAAAVAGIEWYRTSRATPDGPSSAGAPSGLTIHSLAVLPLANLSNDKEQQYFVDGMHEELSTQLQKLGAGGVKVIARMSTLGFRDTPKPPAEIGRELNVEGLISGSVRRAGNRVAIAVQLVRAETGESLWSDSYQRELTDILLLQAEIAHAIARAIGTVLAPGQSGTAVAARKVNPDAYDAYLRGWQSYEYGTAADSILQAKTWLEKAIALDPGLALAYSELGRVYLGLGAGNRLRRHDAYIEAEELMERAIALDDTPETRFNLALLRANTRCAWDELFKVIDELLAVNPNHVTARASLGWMLSFLGRHDEAILQARKSIELNPLCGAGCELNLGITYYWARRYDEALRICRSVTERQPDAVEGWACVASVSFHTGLIKEAIAAMETAAKLQPDYRRYLAVYYAGAGRSTEARRILAGLEKEWSEGRPVSPVTIGMIHMTLGEKEQVFPWIERGFDDYDMDLALLHVPDWDPIRADPRFQWAMKRRSGKVTGPYVAQK